MFQKSKDEKSPRVDFYGNHWPPRGSIAPKTRKYPETKQKPKNGGKKEAGW